VGDHRSPGDQALDTHPTQHLARQAFLSCDESEEHMLTADVVVGHPERFIGSGLEHLHGELADRRVAVLPVFAAVGGMVLPALLYALVAAGGAAGHG
jgi:hypothetical protein